MLVPIAMMALVGQLVGATDYLVTATVPAPMPSGSPVVEHPRSGDAIEAGTITVSGTCPIAAIPVVITISDAGNLIGSGNCGADGTFAIPVTLSQGTHTLTAGIVTITGETGGVSAPISITRTQPTPNTVKSGSNVNTDTKTTGLAPVAATIPVVAFTSPFVTLDSHREALWKGSFSGGAPPYAVSISWGDGSRSAYTVNDGSEQVFRHTYNDAKVYRIDITVTDAMGNVTTTTCAVVTMQGQSAGILDAARPSTDPLIGFIQQYLPQLYIGAFFSLVFLWYLEHGRHLVHWPHLPRMGPHAR